MSNSNEQIVYNTKNNNMKAPKENFTEGINVCVWFLFGCYLIHVGVDSFTKYGLIKDPFQLTLDFFEYIQTYWWLYAAVLIAFWIQVLVGYTTEKLLIWKILSEQTGIGLHIFNSLLILNVVAVLTYAYQCSPFAGINVTGYSFFQTFKFWSYIQTNRKHRLGLHNYKKNEDQDKENHGTKTINYPHNVTLLNLAEFVTTTTNFTYNLDGVKRKPRDFRKAFNIICYSIITHYLCAFLLHQFIIPDVEIASHHLLNRNIFSLIAVTFKLVIPIFILWLFYFYFYCFQCYMTLLACVWGTEDTNRMNDWWNAETTTIYWSKWNVQVHTVLKDCIFVPLLKSGYSKLQASLAVSLVSGILHEYLVAVPCRTGYGIAVFGMLSQIPFAVISTYAYKNFNAKLGNVVFWLSLITGEVGCFIILYYKYNYNNSLTFLQV